MPSRRGSRGSGADTVRGSDGMSRRGRDEAIDETHVASRSDVGRVRVVNEDSCGSYLLSDGARLLVVADGMGGHRGGATASREALAAIAAVFEESTSSPVDASDLRDPHATLRQAIERANARVHAMSLEDPELAGMGTTVVAFLLDATGRGVVAHVGDSRAYRHRGGRLEALTTDHSVVAEMLKRGVLTAEEAAYHPRRNEILRSVGVLPEVEVEVAAVDVRAGDRILLCSDGLCGVVSDAEIDEILAETELGAGEDAVERLVELANECGGPDNVTVELLAISPGWRSGTRARSAVGPGVVFARETEMGASSTANGMGAGAAVGSRSADGAGRSALPLALIALLIAAAYSAYRIWRSG